MSDYDAPGDAAGSPKRIGFDRLRGRLPAARWPHSRILGGLLAVAILALLYYPVGMAVMHRIDDDPEFAPQALPRGGSTAVAVTAALIDRETTVHPWVLNDPWFYPSAALDNMPAFQHGLIYALSRFTIEMADHVGRIRGASDVDPDLDKAAGLLKYPGDRWVWDPSVSLAPQATTETQYQAARRALLSYNERLGQGAAVFERRADNLLVALDRIASDIGSASAALDQHVATHAGALIDLQADDLFYRTKGRLYGYYLILKALGIDYDNVISERELGNAWALMLDSFRQAAVLQPLVVQNSDPEGALFPNHLTAQGFYLMRARTQLREISNILLK